MEDFKIKYIFLIIFMITGVNISFAQDSTFHPAQTEAEKVLNKIISINNKNSYLYNVLLKKEGYKKELEAKYIKLFSEKYRATILNEDKKLTTKYCGNNFDASQGVCGIDYSPVTCEQFGGDNYEFSTLEENKNYAIITYSVDKNFKNAPTFRLINNNGIWILDGVKCSPDDKDIRDFNFTQN